MKCFCPIALDKLSQEEKSLLYVADDGKENCAQFIYFEKVIGKSTPEAFR